MTEITTSYAILDRDGDTVEKNFPEIEAAVRGSIDRLLSPYHPGPFTIVKQIPVKRVTCLTPPAIIQDIL